VQLDSKRTVSFQTVRHRVEPKEISVSALASLCENKRGAEVCMSRSSDFLLPCLLTYVIMKSSVKLF